MAYASVKSQFVKIIVFSICLTTIIFGRHLVLDLIVSIFNTSPPLASKVDSDLTVNQRPLFTDRVEDYNLNITKVRQQVLLERHSQPWTAHNNNKYTLILEYQDDFLQQMSQFKFVHAVVLPWLSDSINSLSPNTLLTQYYQWVGDESLCEWIRSGSIKPFPYHIMYNYTCYSDRALAAKPQSLEPIHFHWKPINKRWYWPAPNGHFPKEHYLNSPEIALYLHVLQDAIVTADSDVFTNTIKVHPNTCGHDHSLRAKPEHKRSPLHKEVFVITQYWGNGFFHRMIETLPRLGPYKQFLQDNPSVKIVVPRVDTMMKKVMGIFEINVDRLVVAPLRAEIVYLPQGTPCGTARVQDSQLMSQIYRHHTEKHLNPGPRNKLVLIQRSGSRHLVNHTQLVKVLKEVAKNSGLEFAHWTDKPFLSFEEGMKMFHEAVMVVAPHGAGEANLIFSQPGTYVIELVCNRPHVNLCFQRLALVLGHRYYGIPSSRGCEGFIDVSVDKIKTAVIHFLDMWKEAL